jgi:protein tyrosine phosphatase (PTP) superfamily phosphohydrolase (DUF442 family)
MKTTPALSEIKDFRRIDEQLGTAGQPAEAQFSAVRDAGYEAVVNLALPTSDGALSNEGSIVTSLGMTYVHIPVNFEAPTPEDFRRFCGVMAAFRDQRVLVHCAANKRVSAFVFLHRVLVQQVPKATAEADLSAVWEPDAVWSEFISQQLATFRPHTT